MTSRGDAGKACRAAPLALAAGWAMAWGGGCSGDVSNGALVKNDLAAMRTARLVLPGGSALRVWLALTPEEQQRGLMNVTQQELTPDRGMLFVFDFDRHQSFWMRNTIIPLDIAYIRSDGTVVKTYTMEPLDESGYPSIEPARFALEVAAGRLSELGLGVGDRIELPAEVVNPPQRPAEPRS